MSDERLRGIVKDWVGFERLVATLRDTGEASVQHDVVLTGESGAPRQIDVLMRARDNFVLIECKYWNKSVERLHVDALVTAVRDLRATKGVVFSTKGFQSGAVIAARHFGIDLFLVREPTDAEWGLPGRVVDFCLQILQPSIGDMKYHDTTLRGQASPSFPIRLDVDLSDGDSRTHTGLINQDGTVGRSLEDVLEHAAMEELVRFSKMAVTINGGEECVRYARTTVELRSDTPLIVPRGDALVIIPSITFELGIKIQQSQVTLDRAKDYLFVLAIVDYVRGAATAASRKHGSDRTLLFPLGLASTGPAKSVFQNGSLMSVALKTFFPFGELSGLKPVPLKIAAPAPATPVAKRGQRRGKKARPS